MFYASILCRLCLELAGIHAIGLLEKNSCMSSRSHADTACLALHNDNIKEKQSKNMVSRKCGLKYSEISFTYAASLTLHISVNSALKSVWDKINPECYLGLRR